MASYTTNLNLKKPAGSEAVAIGDINNNMDTIDQAYGTLNGKITDMGTQVEILNATETTTTEKTLSQSIDNFRYIIIEALSNNGAIFSSQIVPVVVFKTHAGNTNPSMLYWYDGGGYRNLFIKYINTTKVSVYITTGYHLVLRGIK